MPDNPNKPFHFWQELKRRKVIRRNMVYAATGFVILEFISNITEPFGLPDWTLKLVFIILCIGFVFSIILSWFYDFTPDGLEKIKSANEPLKAPPEKPSRLIAWKIATYISAFLIVGLVLFNILGGRKQAEDLSKIEKSIAVRPFKSLSDDPEKQYLADGVMDAILLHLSKIEDLRVMSRTSVEQYRETDKTTIVIGEELNVVYLLEGSFQKYGDRAKLIVQLIKTSDDSHIWSNEYDRDWKDIFSVQGEVAQIIAGELQAIITPDEKQLIEKKPTTSLTAYDFYQRGREEHVKYWLDNDNKKALERAEDFYHEALDYDSAFAQAFTGLAWVYRDKHYWETFLTENFLDSMLILADIALSFDDQLAEAYIVRGEYNQVKGINEKAIEEFDKALKFNPNDWRAYDGKGWLYLDDDLVKSIDNFHKAASLNRGSELPSLLGSISLAYQFAGFGEKAKYYSKEALKLEVDSVEYFLGLAAYEYDLGNYAKAIEILKKGYAIDSNEIFTLRNLGMSYMFLGQFEESLKYFEKEIERLKEVERLNLINMVEIGYVYWQNGSKEEAEYYFNEQINYCNSMNELGRAHAQKKYTYYDLAAVHAFRGEKDKAFENLRIFNQRQWMPFWAVSMIKNDPLFDSIRNEPEFQQIVRDVEAKYRAEHERVRKWLEEQGMI
jgi:TolB-like protein/Flp pilus assembly protein TadD